MQAADLPILGEPVGIELANTWYGLGPDAFDVLAAPALAATWVARVAGPGPLDDLRQLRELRDAARALFAARADGRPLPRRAVAALNRHAAAGHAAATLRLDPAGAPLTTIRFSGPGAVRARLATSCMEVLTGPHPVARCAGDGCGLFFVQQHGRRRFCHDGCSHRLRQQRYRQGAA